mmetsp:Transcript_7791/g.10319  ORF Transcript_7791/g.10319 Transcript_7791/m.10319 type:complete len:86 (+) Transcript_7791:914-1171(+)
MDGTQAVRQHFRIARSTDFVSQQVREQIERLFFSYGASLRHAFDNVVVAVGNGDVFGDVNGVEYVGASGRDCDLESVGVQERSGA